MGFPTKVISCGRPGASHAAIWAAKQLNLPTGGYSSWSNVIRYNLSQEFGICALPIQRETRSQNDVVLGVMQCNVDASHATIVVRIAANPNLDKIIDYARNGLPNARNARRKPVLVVSNLDDEKGVAAGVRLFLSENAVQTVNVCGHAQILFMPDYEERLRRIFTEAFRPTF